MHDIVVIPKDLGFIYSFSKQTVLQYLFYM